MKLRVNNLGGTKIAQLILRGKFEYFEKINCNRLRNESNVAQFRDQYQIVWIE